MTEEVKNEAFPEPTKAEVIEAHAQGVKDAIAESTKEAYKRGANEGYGDTGAPAQKVWQGTKDVFHLQDLVGLEPKALADRISEKAANPLSEGQIAGLLEVERSGKNRTDTVAVFCKRLGVKSPYEVTAAGPNFTNDTSKVTSLK